MNHIIVNHKEDVQDKIIDCKVRLDKISLQVMNVNK
jgi:hypothetical protein